MAGFEKLLDIIKQNREIVEDEAAEKANCPCCNGFIDRFDPGAHFCDDCDITWRRMGVCTH